MPILGQLLQNLISNSFGDSTPVKNDDPNAYDEKGFLKPGYVPYHDPNWVARWLTPEMANYQIQANDAVRQEYAKAENANTAKKKVATGNAKITQSALTTPVAQQTPEQFAVGSGFEPYAPNAYQMDTLTARRNANIPVAQAQEEYARSLGATRGYQTRNLIGAPEAAARAEYSGNTYANEYNLGQSANLPQRLGLEKSRLIAEQSLVQPQTDAARALANVQLNQSLRELNGQNLLDKLYARDLANQSVAQEGVSADAQVKRAMALEALQNVDTQTALQTAMRRNALFEAEHPPVTSRDPRLYRDLNGNVKVIPGRPTMGQMGQIEMNAPAPPITHSVGNGLRVVAPASSPSAPEAPVTTSNRPAMPKSQPITGTTIQDAQRQYAKGQAFLKFKQGVPLTAEEFSLFTPEELQNFGMRQ